jgi:5-(carboxyamino)imidazole ribonucleotide mutase
MPSGIPVATVGIDGAKNAGLMAARILSIKYPDVQQRLEIYAQEMADKVKAAKID